MGDMFATEPPTGVPTSMPTPAPTSAPTPSPTSAPTLNLTIVIIITKDVTDQVNSFLSDKGLPTMSESMIMETVKDFLMSSDMDLSSLSGDDLTDVAASLAQDLMNGYK